MHQTIKNIKGIVTEGAYIAMIYPDKYPIPKKPWYPQYPWIDEDIKPYKEYPQITKFQTIQEEKRFSCKNNETIMDIYVNVAGCIKQEVNINIKNNGLNVSFYDKILNKNIKLDINVDWSTYNQDKIKASITNGVLHISIEKNKHIKKVIIS